ncbi:hypothetical protein [Streptomyces sp. SP18BB07]|uniref:hypothetical protein n=1 Tax=Streptomyces sp. SP18BB07 TaxID=3002522 RepID=UPI002E7715FD|nr:hypothetical protein [Streptomyces sp. SP18BB07]MEE1764317.1 hypothetical protein [Streptomyces sp. SP18BB07]
MDAGTKDLRAADHLLQALAVEVALPEDAFGCTHPVCGDRPRVGLSFTLPSEPFLRTARERLTARRYEVTPGVPDAAGRAVVHPGESSLTGTLTVAHLLDRSTTDRGRYWARPPDRPRTPSW